ncbi:glycoside hydrolase family 9 protein [Pelagicoccus mobilis]|uniref:Glycoside hydrolase family 9 protein n=1 Tax=Pelagicoccus mobilis TaxID=415221 RepID=A0A934VTP3_9BACT|nr:glycoside hydrolase family 9 protein [Pelagicoccus mobilis]MBK1879724.1 glycoside hydrolase family 9 protein [Pelagicoccus mobilis]
MRYSTPIIAALFVLTFHSFGQPDTVQELIRVNQFGYQPEANKVAVIANPMSGYNQDSEFLPGETYQIRRSEDDSVAFEATIEIWQEGKVHEQSGDQGWWFDFSSLEEPGEYYVWDVQNEARSHLFEISETIYNQVLIAAVRTFFYQRLAFKKEAKFAGEDWADDPAFLQDSATRNVFDRENSATEKDLSGGWMDAGDYNKYVTFAEVPIHQLLNAYEERPSIWGDNYNIPESGNGIPDLLDEIHFEMLWLEKMQEDDGGVLLKMGDVDFNVASPPSTDARDRFYLPACSSSTISASGMYAHAAFVFKKVPQWAEMSARLESRAIDAWNWYHANPKETDCDTGIVKSGDADRPLYRQLESSILAAIYLHQLTGDQEYSDYIESNYLDLATFVSGTYSLYNAYASEALLNYAFSKYATPEFAAEIKRRRETYSNTDMVLSWQPGADLYRGYMPDDQYHWGSNIVRANLGNACTDFFTFELSPKQPEALKLRAENMLHYFFGVNPMGIVYMTNMGSFGAEKSAMQIYHSWYSDGSAWDENPAPGFVPGGPNASYSGSIESLKEQPVQKSYLDFNDNWPKNSWEITEPAIYYQSSFIKFLSRFIPEPNLDLTDSDEDQIISVFESWMGLSQETQEQLSSQICFSDGDQLTVVEFPHNPLQSHLPVEIEVSSDLRNWAPLDLNQGSIRQINGRSIAEIPTENLPESQRFARLRLVGN